MWPAPRVSKPRPSANGCASTAIRTSGTWCAFGASSPGTDVNHWWDDGANAIAFSRGNRGFVAINREDTTVAATIATGVPPGTYCDLLTGGLVGAACVGTTIVVDSTGAVQLQLAPVSAIAIDTSARM